MVMATVQIPSDQAQALGALYERACKLQEGFADKHKVTMARLVKFAMRPLTIERLVEGIEAALPPSALSPDDAEVLRAMRSYLHEQRARQLADGSRAASPAIEAAVAAYHALITAGMPPSALPAVAGDARFPATAHALITSIYNYFHARGACDRAAGWRDRADQLAAMPGDPYTTEEAARLAELACRWAADRFAEDEHHGTITLTGPLIEPAAPGRLATGHLEGAISLDHMVYQPAALVGNLAFCQRWVRRHPFAYHVVATRCLERVLGYLAILPMTLDAILGVLQAGDDARVPLDEIAGCAPGDRVCLYVPSVVVRRDCDRSAVKHQLRESLMQGLRGLRSHSVEIEAIVAVGYTDGGRSLLREHGFQVAPELEARLGARSALLGGERHLYRISKADSPRGRYGGMLHAVAFGP